MRTVCTPKKAQLFLAALAETGNVTVSCQKADLKRRAIYAFRATDESFRAAWDEAVEAAADLLEEEARRRAADGWEENVYKNGELIGTIRHYSDVLLIFLLKGIRPYKYRERVQLDINGLDRELERARELFGLSDEEAERLKMLAVAEAETVVRGRKT